MLVKLGKDPYRGDIHYRLALFYAAENRAPKAVEQFRLSLDANPRRLTALLKLSFLLLTCDEPELRNGPEALQYAEKACSLTGNSNPQHLSVLASALAECGRGPEAIATLEKAQSLARANGNEGFALQSTKLIEFYRNVKTVGDYLAANK